MSQPGKEALPDEYKPRIADKLRSLIASEFGVNPDQITPRTPVHLNTFREFRNWLRANLYLTGAVSFDWRNGFDVEATLWLAYNVISKP